MTAPMPFTQANVQRRIRAAKAEGLRVVGIAPDGTVLVNGPDETGSPVHSNAKLAPEASPYSEVEA